MYACVYLHKCIHTSACRDTHLFMWRPERIRSPLGWCYKQLRDVWPVSPVLGPEFMSSLYSKCSQLPSFLYPNPWLSSVLLFFQVIKTISNRVSIISQIFIHYILNKVSAMCLGDHIQHFFVIYTENNFSLLSPEAHREACNFNCTILKAALARIQKHLIIYTFFQQELLLWNTCKLTNPRNIFFFLSNFKQQGSQNTWNLYNPKLCFPN